MKNESKETPGVQDLRALRTAVPEGIQYYSYESVKLDYSKNDVSWKDIERLLAFCHTKFGPRYQFSPLHRAEGGIMMLKGQGFVSTEPAEGESPKLGGADVRSKHVRFCFQNWPSFRHRIIHMSEEEKNYKLVPLNSTAMPRQRLVHPLKFKSINCTWSTEEHDLMCCTIIQNIGWPLLRSKNSKRVSAALGLHSTVADTQE